MDVEPPNVVNALFPLGKCYAGRLPSYRSLSVV